MTLSSDRFSKPASLIRVASGQWPTFAGGFHACEFLANSGVATTSLQVYPREIIYREGDKADSVYFIETGTVKLTVVSSEGKEATIALLGTGELLGEACISGNLQQRISTAEALSRCAMLRISRNSMNEVIRKHPRFLDYFLSFIVSRNLRMQQDLMAQLFTSSEKRLARVLLMLAGLSEGTEDAEARVHRLSHEELAEIVGTTRSRISFFMNRFRKHGHVAYAGNTAELLVRKSLRSVVLDIPACEHCSTGPRLPNLGSDVSIPGKSGE